MDDDKSVTSPAKMPTGRPDWRVLCLGWQREAFEALRRLGATVACVVPAGERRKPAAEGFDGPLAVAADHTRVDSVLAALAAIGLTPADFWTVCTDDEFAIVPAAVLSALGCARPASVPVALALRDKPVQKSLVRATGICTADSRRLDDLTAVRGSDYPTPFVVKPPAGAGAQHTWIVRDPADLVALEGAASAGGVANEPWLVERFVPGEELHVDGVVRAGEVLLASVSRYLHNVIDLRQGRLVGSVTLDDATEGDIVAAVTDLTTRVLVALGHSDGVFHLEVFHDEGRLVFGECAGRIGGGMINEAVRAKYGVDLYAEWAAAVLELPSPTARGDRNVVPHSFGWVNLPSRPGRIRSLPTREAIEGRPGVVQAQVWASVGETVGDMRLGSHLVAAKALVCAPSAAATRAQLAAMGEWFSTAIEVDDRDQS